MADIPPPPFEMNFIILAQIFSSYSVGATLGVDLAGKHATNVNPFSPYLHYRPRTALYPLAFPILTMPVPDTTVPRTAAQYVKHFDVDKDIVISPTPT